LKQKNKISSKNEIIKALLKMDIGFKIVSYILNLKVIFLN